MMATMLRRNMWLLLATIASYMLLNIVVFIDCCHALFFHIVIYTQQECRNLR